MRLERAPPVGQSWPPPPRGIDGVALPRERLGEGGIVRVVLLLEGAGDRRRHGPLGSFREAAPTNRSTRPKRGKRASCGSVHRRK